MQLLNYGYASIIVHHLRCNSEILNRGFRRISVQLQWSCSKGVRKRERRVRKGGSELKYVGGGEEEERRGG